MWKPAFIEIKDAPVPGFIIEQLADGRLAVFVPLDVPFTQPIKPISRWGSGCGELVAAIKT